jgi:inhibitor of KinA
MLPIPQIYPLGDHAITITFANEVEEQANANVLSLHQHLLRQPVVFWRDIIPAYASLTIVYDTAVLSKAHRQSAYRWVKNALEEALVAVDGRVVAPLRKMHVPVCYELSFGLDSVALCKTKNVTMEELVQLHTGTTYRVYMLGFLPGFAYMGSVHPRIAVPRLATPRMVPPGSVGIAGVQTGIYPFSSPGGWHIIGRTPLSLFNASAQQPALLQAGDEVVFTPISKEEFNSYYK